MRTSRRNLVSLLLVALVTCLTFPAQAATALGRTDDVRSKPTEHQTGRVELRRIGKPDWKPVDFQLFSAPIGPAPDVPEFLTTALALLPPPNHVFHPQLAVGPGAPHPPPYNRELRRGVKTLDFHRNGPFDVKEFSSGNGIWVAWMNVPRPGTRGSSPDFRRGRIISNDLFPIRITGTAYRNGQIFDPALADFEVPPLDSDDLEPRFDVDGHSHFPVFIADSVEFGPVGIDPAGNYKYDLEIVDQQGEGWRIVARFVVRR